MTEKSYTLKELAEITKSKLIGQPEYLITNVADLESATSQDASFLANARYEQAMQRSQAGVIFVHPSFKPQSNQNFLVNEDPSRAFQIVLELFIPKPNCLSGFSGIHPTAVIHPSAQIGQSVTIGPYAVIDEEVLIGKGTFIGSGSYIGPQVIIGEDCVIHPRVTIREHCKLGNRVILQPGAVIGSCGFGYTTDKNGRHTKLNQVGNVVIEDDVEIGANTTIDRSRFKSTNIENGTKIDNLVQIGHGVGLGPHNIVVAQTGIAGSTTTGKNVVFGGQCAINGHIDITAGVMIAARSGVSKSIIKPGKYGGVPILPLSEYNRNTVQLRNIGETLKKLEELEKKVAELEKLANLVEKN